MTQIIECKKTTKIYIYCEANMMSGGPEALHQLRWYLERNGYNAYLVYTGVQLGKNPTPSRYAKYVIDETNIVDINDIEDSSDNCVIASESQTARLWETRYTKKIIWWLSVINRDTNFMDNVFSLKTRVKRLLLCCSFWHPSVRPFARSRAVNLCASKFAYEFVTNRLHLPADYLVEPLSKEFLDIGMYYDKGTCRLNKVAYNPSKPSAVMNKLLRKNDFEFIPIKGMTPQQIADVFRNVKLYVDFGNFPGPERMPKEAVYNGANILVGYRNAAKNDFDIAIPDLYKIRNYNDVEYVTLRIQEMLNNYQNHFHDFDNFRRKIDNLEYEFEYSLNKIFYKKYLD